MGAVGGLRSVMICAVPFKDKGWARGKTGTSYVFANFACN